MNRDERPRPRRGRRITHDAATETLAKNPDMPHLDRRKALGDVDALMTRVHPRFSCLLHIGWDAWYDMVWRESRTADAAFAQVAKDLPVWRRERMLYNLVLSMAEQRFQIHDIGRKLILNAGPATYTVAALEFTDLHRWVAPVEWAKLDPFSLLNEYKL